MCGAAWDGSTAAPRCRCSFQRRHATLGLLIDKVLFFLPFLSWAMHDAADEAFYASGGFCVWGLTRLSPGDW